MLTAGRGGNRAGRAGLGRANSGPGQNWAGPKLARFFRVTILTAHPALKTGPVGPKCLFKEKKIRAGRVGPGHTGPDQIWPGFFRAKNLMAQPGPNFGRIGLAHRAGPILPPLTAGDALAKSQKVTIWSQKKWLWMLFFLLTAEDALRTKKIYTTQNLPKCKGQIWNL